MKAIWNEQVIAEAPKEELIYIEGNWYFLPTSLKKYFTNYFEFWRGVQVTE